MLVHIALSVARGMQGIHDFGIIHRDLKAGNILLKFPEGKLPEVVICGMISLDASLPPLWATVFLSFFLSFFSSSSK